MISIYIQIYIIQMCTYVHMFILSVPGELRGAWSSETETAPQNSRRTCDWQEVLDSVGPSPGTPPAVGLSVHSAPHAHSEHCLRMHMVLRSMHVCSCQTIGGFACSAVQLRNKPGIQSIVRRTHLCMHLQPLVLTQYPAGDNSMAAMLGTSCFVGSVLLPHAVG